jgi:hypothetical protein
MREEVWEKKCRGGWRVFRRIVERDKGGDDQNASQETHVTAKVTSAREMGIEKPATAPSTSGPGPPGLIGTPEPVSVADPGAVGSAVDEGLKLPADRNVSI